MSKYVCKYCDLDVLKQPCGCPGRAAIKALKEALVARGITPAGDLSDAQWVALGSDLKKALRR